jgi:hypothetical protein
MKFNVKVLAMLSTITFLSGCEYIETINFTGTLRPISAEVLQVIEAITGSSPEVPEGAIVSSDNLQLSINSSECVEEDNGIVKGATGTLVLDDREYEINSVICGKPLSEPLDLDLDDPFGFLLLVDTVLVATATPLDPLPSELAGVRINVNRFLDNVADFDPALAPVAGLQFFTLNEDSGQAIGSIGDSNETFASGILSEGPPPARPAIVQAQQDLVALVAGLAGPVQHILRRASRTLNFAASDRFWLSDTELASRHGRFVFHYVAFAVNNIERIADNTFDNNLMSELDAISSSLLDTSRQLAEQRLTAATEANVDSHALYRANRALEHGDLSRAHDQLRSAVLLYGKTWRVANRSLR